MEIDIEKNAMDQMIKARTRLLFDFPFWGSQSIRYTFESTNNYKGIRIDTALTNGKIIAFNPEYVNSLNLGKKIFLCAHETGHNMLKHSAQLKGYDRDIANQAMDYTVNDILISEGIGDPIDGILIDKKYAGMAWQEVYKILYQEKQENEKQKKADQKQDDKTDDSNQGNDSDSDSSDNSQDRPGNDQTSCPGDVSSQSDDNSQDAKQDDTSQNQVAADPAGSVIDCPIDMDHSEVDSDIKQSIQNSLNYAKKAGKMPGQKIQDIVKEILAPSANCWELLKQWYDSIDKSDVSFTRPIDRQNGYYSPGFYSEGLNKLIIAIDVSESVTSQKNAINSFQSNINELKNIHQVDCDVIYFHSTIERIETYQKHEDINIEVVETGGTRLMPVFGHISDNGLNNQIAGLIVFTDLEIFDFPEQETGYKMLFVKYGQNRYCERAPIGETISIKE